MSDPRLFISVTTPVLNEQRYIEQYLESLARQTYPADSYEILLADGGSTDRTTELVQAFQRAHPELAVRFWQRPGTGRETRLNLCLQEARGNLLARIDAHSRVPANYLETVAEIFRHPPLPRLAAVGGPVLPLAEGGLSRAIGLAMQSRFGMGHVEYRRPDFEGPVATVQNAAYDRVALAAVGGFDETIGCEDSDLHYRLRQADYVLFITPRLRFHYCPRRTLGGLARQLWNYGGWRMRFFRKHELFPPLRYLLPMLFVAGVAAAPLALLAPAPLPGLAALGTALYGAAALGFALRQCGWRAAPSVPVVCFLYPLMHAAYGAGQWVEVLRLLGRRGEVSVPTLGNLRKVR